MKYDYKDERYTFLDYIKVKVSYPSFSITSPASQFRKWEVHVLYEDKDGLKYSREVGEFFERFKEVRPDFPPGWRDEIRNHLNAEAKKYIHGKETDTNE